jgi:hypothetical protein
MHRARFWIGVLILTSPFAGFVVSDYGRLLAAAPTVDGRVMYHGRPVKDTWVTLEASDREQSGDMIGRTDREGYFRCRPQWWNPSNQRLAFDIRVYPDPRRARREAPSSSLGAEPASAVRGGDGGKRRVALASMSMVRQTPPAVARILRRPDHKPIEVSIGSEPVYLDIDVKD